jgi:hypothetical protein
LVEVILGILVMSITLTVLFKTFNQSLVHSARLFEQNRLIWMAESLLEKIKFSSFNDISHCLIWKQPEQSLNRKEYKNYCYYVIDQDNHAYISSQPDTKNKFFSFLVEATPMTFNQELNVLDLEKKTTLNALKINLKIEHQRQKITLTGFKWVKNNASF